MTQAVQVRTFRDHFVERFPTADADTCEMLITVAEAIVGEGPISADAASGFLDVAACKLRGEDWICPDVADDEADCLPVTPQERNGFTLEAVFSHLGPSQKSPSGRPILRGSVYCAQQASGGHTKIGFSTDLAARIYTLSGANPEPVVLLAHARAYDFVEKDLHKLLHEHRRHCEWFADVPAVREVVATLAATCRRLEAARPLDLPTAGEA